MKRKKIRTPGGRNVLHRKKNKTSPQKCSNCGKILHGIKRMDISEVSKVSASQKRISRKFGGNMCTSCSRDILRARARNI